MRTAPPRGYLSRSNPLAQGLSAAVTFDEGTGPDLYDRVSNQIWRHRGGGTSQWSGSNAGNGYEFRTVAANNDFAYQGTPESILATTNLSILIVQRKLDTTLRASSAFGPVSGSVCQAHMPYSDGTVYWDFGGNASPNRLTASTTGLDLQQDNVWTFTAGDHGSEIWFNGHRLASQTTPITRSGTALNFFINSGAVGGDIALYSVFYIYQRVLQESEIKRLAIDPYAPFRPQELLPPGDAPITGTGASTLDDVTSDGDGTYTPVAITGTGASTLDGVTSAGSGTFTPAAITGAGASTLDGVTSSGSGNFIAAISGTGASTLTGVTSAGAGTYTPGAITGTGSSTLDGVVSDGDGNFIAPITGTGASTLAGVTSTGTGNFASAGTVGNVVCDVLQPLNATCEVQPALVGVCTVSVL